jgi:3-oxoacyl-[acyl-carrier-protein] synthase II
MNRLGENRRVVVTGFGVISPLGLSAKTTWRQALKGASGVNTTTCFDTTDCPVQISAEVKDFDVTRKVGPFRPDSKTEISQASSAKDAKRVGRFVHLALAAGLDAYEDSGLDSFRDQLDPRRLGVNIGVGIGGLTEIETVHNEFLAKGYRRITPFFIPLVIPNMASGQLSILLNLKGPNLCNVTACTSSAHSIGESFRQIQRGEADIMFAGGAEAVIGKLAIGGFAAMKALSAKNQEPQKASRPFDKDRDGFVMGEGAVVLVLEALEVAQKRNARIYS